MPPPPPAPSEWFAAEVQPHEAALRAWLRARFPGLTDGDDIVQEAFVRVLRAHAAGPVFSARALLFTAARNLALNRLRDRRRDPAQFPLAGCRT
jgi:RNA polymerase sigma-70 factor (ECF subfamily)